MSTKVQSFKCHGHIGTHYIVIFATCSSLHCGLLFHITTDFSQPEKSQISEYFKCVYFIKLYVIYSYSKYVGIKFMIQG